MRSSGISSKVVNQLRDNVDTLFISKINEAYIRVKSNPSVLQELTDYFTFSVPGFQFMPAFRNKLWDGKIRLFSAYDQKLYYGLLPYVESFAKKRNYPYVSQIQEYVKVSDEDLFDYVINLNLPFPINLSRFAKPSI